MKIKQWHKWTLKVRRPSMGGMEWVLLIVTALTAGLSLYMFCWSSVWFAGAG